MRYEAAVAEVAGAVAPLPHQPLPGLPMGDEPMNETVVHEHDGEPLTKAWLLTENVTFERIAMAVIVLNTVLLLVDPFVDGYEHALETVHHVILGCFAAEVVIKLAAVRWRVRTFLNKPWNVFDTVVVTVSLLPFVGAGALMLRMARLARLLHSARHVQHVRLLRFFKRMPVKAETA